MGTFDQAVSSPAQQEVELIPTASRRIVWGIWALALGYFASYVPYSALTKAVSSGMLEKMDAPVRSGFVLLPVSVTTSMLGMITFLSLMRWWHFAGQRRLLGRRVPSPNRWTLLSGLCTAGIIGTTTLAYTFEGVSIVFMMLLMRGGVLMLAPLVDTVSRRRVRWFSWVALLLSISALVVAFSERGGSQITVIAAVDVTIYLLSYFVRLRFMSRLAKSEDPRDSVRYFVEEQMVATPAVVLTLGLMAGINRGDIFHDVRAGFAMFAGSPILLETILIGLFSQGTGIFGGLVLLDKSENTYCVPVNRSSSILAGVVATYGLSVLLGARTPSAYELFGAALIIVAILFLTLPLLLRRARAAQPVPDARRGAQP